MCSTAYNSLIRRSLTYKAWKSARSFATYPRSSHPAYNMPHEPKVTKVEPLPANEAKWIEFQKISWVDQTQKSRVWEAASRKTRGKSGVDAVAVRYGSHIRWSCTFMRIIFSNMYGEFVTCFPTDKSRRFKGQTSHLARGWVRP
jgi:hypothetical protein